MTPLGERIAALIAVGGPISVSEYFALCLSDPTHGYYMTRDPFGRDGDFTTAPEISQMFGELVGVWLASAWRALGNPRGPLITEIGPGRGTLTKDIVRTLAKIEPDLRNSARFGLIETSERLRQVQATTLAGLGRFDWHARIEDLPHEPLLIVGNELFDAIPIRQYVRTKGNWRERMVGLDDAGNLAFVAAGGSLDPQLLPSDADTGVDGAIYEISPARAALMQTIAERIAATGGAGLFIDYGALRWGLGDTLQAVRRHKPEPVLMSPGEADVTAHVDFATLADVARATGLDVHTATQGAFLLELGLLERAGRLGAALSDLQQAAIQAAVERLAAPDQMGDLFKVLAITPKGVSVPGFGKA